MPEKYDFRGNMKYPIIFLLLFSWLTVAAEIVARVGEYAITSEQVESELSDFEGDYDLPLPELHKLALHKLIEEQLLLIYAKEKGISVSRNEVESYFMSVLGNDPKLMTNGRFDYAKFRELKKTPEVKKIMQEMKKDILINKTRSLIEESFQLTDEKLMERFILENAKVDIGYALINMNDVVMSGDYNSQKARGFFATHRNLFLSPRKVKLRFFIVPFADFAKTACDSITPKIAETALTDTLHSEAYFDSLRFKLIREATIRLTEKKAENQKRLAENELPISYPMLESYFLTEKDSLGKIPPKILHNAFQMEENQFSEPLETEIGFLVFQVVEIQEPKEQKLEDIPQKVWREYIKFQKSQPQNEERKRFYYKHLNDFITKAALITKIEIPLSANPFLKLETKKENQAGIIDLLKKNENNFSEFNRICRENKLHKTKQIIFLEKFNNKTDSDKKISRRIKNDEISGFIKQNNGSVIYYRLETIIPEYIPEFSEINGKLPEISADSVIDTTGFYDYFQKHKKSFQHPDSLQLGICLIPVEPDSVRVSQNEMKKYYRKNLISFQRDKAVKFDYVFSSQTDFIRQIYNYARDGIDFYLLNFCFNEKDIFPRNEIVESEKLPQVIRDSLSALNENEISAPFRFDDGWIILKKRQDFSGGIIDFSEAAADIRSKLQITKANDISSLRAKTIFDSTQYFSQCYRYAKEKNIFKTAFQNAENGFEILGDISDYKKELLRMWKNEKFSRIIKTEHGYALVFLLKKKASAPMNYAEAIPLIKQKMQAQKQQKFARIFVKNLRRQIIEGANPDSVLFFFGGWRKAKNLNLDSKIPDIKFSSQFLEDISRHEEGYFSPVMKISENALLFYHIDKMNKIYREDFLANKEEFKKKTLQKLFSRWLKEQKAKVNIRIF